MKGEMKELWGLELRCGSSNYCKSTFVTSSRTVALVMMHTVS